MGIIRLNNICCYAYHGCLTEEAAIGSAYRDDLWVRADFSKAVKSDKLSDTVDYVKLNQLVETEMAKRSHLLEAVAQRIVDELFNAFAQVHEVGVVVP